MAKHKKGINKYSRYSSLSFLATILIWSLVVVVWFQRQDILDWWRLQGYEPPSEIVALADATSMNQQARRLFYVNQPQLQDKEKFNESCRDGEFTIVLGCYISNNGIYIFNVKDPRLDGIEEVTAAHELLHAAYERLSSDDRSQIDELLAQTFENLKEERIKKVVKQYEDNDPSSVPNELHSILGTEVRDLPPELESYYKRYFQDRTKIVFLSEAYEKAFDERLKLIKQYETRLKSLQVQIDLTNNELKATSESLKQDFQRLESSRNVSDPDEFNARAQQYNIRVKSYNQSVANVSRLIDVYNSTYNKYSEIVLEHQDLFSSIDSRPKQLQSQ